MATTKLNDILHKRPDITPSIYGFTLPDVASHKGYIKVGYTTRNVEERINEILHTSGLSHKTVLVESAMREDGSVFLDKAVHAKLKAKGIKQLNENDDKNEWYECTVEDVKNAILEVKFRKNFETTRTENFKMREEQENAVSVTQQYFEKSKIEDSSRAPKFLWNAKMRFGKTFATYQLAKRMGLKRVLILTFKPAVESAWQDDIRSHIDFDGWQFISEKSDSSTIDKQYEQADKEQTIVVFGSLQDLLGTTESGSIKVKNEFIHLTNWDLVVFDEYHFGAWRDNAKKLFQYDEEENSDIDFESYSKNELGNAMNESWLPITSDRFLYLSGTPFRSLNSGEFLEDQIYNWTYSDEQSAKLNWDNKKGPNPYESLPQMIMMTYKVPSSISQVAVNEGFDEFDINEFFRASFEKKHIENAKFVYESDVQKWLKLIQGEYLPVDGLKLGSDKPPMPFSDSTLLNVLIHTVWYLPDVASCYAMKNLLTSPVNKFFNNYKIIVCAGAEVGVGIDALKPVYQAMGNPLQTKSITLTCGKLTTGVTVKPWSGIFMLRNLNSPESYFQAAFRVQSPWVIKGSQEEDYQEHIMKKECYLFDFSLERSLRQVAEYSMKLSQRDSTPEKKVSDFINFLPVLAFDGSSMNKISAQDVLDITYSGTSATLLAKRWQTALLVHVDNDTLKRLQKSPSVLEALMNIEGFRSLGKEIATIINKSENIKKAKKSNDPLSPKEITKLTEEEKEIRALRKQVQENLLKLAARIPAFMYLTDYREQCIKDVITHVEPELFTKVTGLSVNDFDMLCSIGLFDSDKMNQGIFGFRKYENSSLTYTGIDKHVGEDVGGWDTVLTRTEYQKLYDNQKITMMGS